METKSADKSDDIFCSEFNRGTVLRYPNLNKLTVLDLRSVKVKFMYPLLNSLYLHNVVYNAFFHEIWNHLIREIPDHATFREKEHTLGWLDKLGGFLSLSLCNLTNFDHLYLAKYRYCHFTSI